MFNQHLWIFCDITIPYIYVCRSSVANVSTTLVERAVIVVALVTTNKPGWQEPSTLDISVRVRKMYTNANHILQLHTATIDATGHDIVYEAWVQWKWVFTASQRQFIKLVWEYVIFNTVYTGETFCCFFSIRPGWQELNDPGWATTNPRSFRTGSHCTWYSLMLHRGSM